MPLSIPFFFVVGIYLFARGIFALFGQPIFYTQRALENIDPQNLSAYLKEEGTWNMIAGFVFVGKAILDKLFPGSTVLWIVFVLLLLICVFFHAKCNEKYIKK